MRLILVLAFAFCVSGQEEAPKQRIKAASALAREGAAGIPKLVPYQQDTDTGVRRAAAEALAAIGGPASLDPLLATLKDTDSEVQITAISGLVNFYLPGYYQSGWRSKVKRSTDQVVGRFVSPDEPIVPPHVEARPEIVSALGALVATSPSMETRAAAARALGILRGNAASAQLVEALTTKKSEVLYESLIALGKIKNPEVAPRLFYMLRDPEEKVQIAAIETVSVLGNREANAPLREAWAKTRNRKVQRVLMEAMAMLPSEDNRELLESQLNSTDEGLRAAAAEGLGRLGRAEDRARLEPLWTEERKMRPRLALAFAVVSLGNRELSDLSPLQYLVNTLNHSGWKGVAHAFLTELARDPGVRYGLYSVLRSANKDEKLAIVEILGYSGQKDSIEPLEQLSKDTDTAIATQALRSLQMLRSRLQ